MRVGGRAPPRSTSPKAVSMTWNVKQPIKKILSKNSNEDNKKNQQFCKEEVRRSNAAGVCTTTLNLPKDLKWCEHPGPEEYRRPALQTREGKVSEQADPLVSTGSK